MMNEKKQICPTCGRQITLEDEKLKYLATIESLTKLIIGITSGLIGVKSALNHGLIDEKLSTDLLNLNEIMNRLLEERNKIQKEYEKKFPYELDQ